VNQKLNQLLITMPLITVVSPTVQPKCVHTTGIKQSQPRQPAKNGHSRHHKADISSPAISQHPKLPFPKVPISTAAPTETLSNPIALVAV
jgi:hypothetical protein